LALFAFNGGVACFAGTATAEGHIVDANTGKLIWQRVDQRGSTSAIVKETLTVPSLAIPVR
jgi:hypothetical protein